MRGQDVRVLQQLLTDWGLPTEVDGSSAATPSCACARGSATAAAGSTAASAARTRSRSRPPSTAVSGCPARSPSPSRSATRRSPRRARRRRSGPTAWPSRPPRRPRQVKAIIAAGNEIHDMPYKYGGGHGKWKDSGYDCSGSMSYAFHGAGMLDAGPGLHRLHELRGRRQGPVGHDLRQLGPLLHGRGRPALRHERSCRAQARAGRPTCAHGRATRSAIRRGSRRPALARAAGGGYNRRDAPPAVPVPGRRRAARARRLRRRRARAERPLLAPHAARCTPAPSRCPRSSGPAAAGGAGSRRGPPRAGAPGARPARDGARR